MRSLPPLDVPDEVIDRLSVLAAREGMTLQAFAERELTDTARRADNASLSDALPDIGVEAASVVKAVQAGRAAR